MVAAEEFDDSQDDAVEYDDNDGDVCGTPH